jgi:hypothetical protein
MPKLSPLSFHEFIKNLKSLDLKVLTAVVSIYI